MRILMLYASAGGGHKKAAEVVSSYLKKQDENIQVKLVDTLKEVNWLADKFCCDGYQFVAKYAPSIFGAFYQSANKENKFSKLIPKLTAHMSYKLLPLIQRFQPDLILTTYHFSTQMISHLKATKQIDIPLVCILTDYGPHRAWISPLVDAYIVSDESMVSKLEAFGVNPAIVHPFGIPVENKFFAKENKEALLRHLKLDPDLPTLLLMSGSFGVRSIKDIYLALDSAKPPMQLIVITGKNKRLYQELQQLVAQGHKETRLVYFTKHVEKYMHAADLLVTKPGGLTISEALASGLPLAVFDAIPGQEEDNAKFLIENHMGFPIQPNQWGAKEIEDLLASPDRLHSMRSACRCFDKSDCVENIISLMEQLL